LDVGCGTADLTIRLMNAYPGCTALGVDGSVVMLASGRALVRTAGLETCIHLEQRYFPDAALASGGFDAVTANSLLHHLSDPAAFWRAARGCAKPGAPLLVADLRPPDDSQTVERLVDQYAWRAKSALKRDFWNSLHAAYTVEEVRRQLQAAGQADLTVEEMGPLHLVVWGYGA
jgi:ubiquinone/menaquinone biosynthesis C-methylase UbiE